MTIFSNIRDAFMALAGAALATIVITVYWLGLPILNDYPILNRIPFVGSIAVGHIETVRQEARAGYVEEAEKIALASQLAEERRRRLEAAQIATDARNRADAALRAEQAQSAALETEISEYETHLGADVCRLDSDGLDFLRKP